MHSSRKRDGCAILGRSILISDYSRARPVLEDASNRVGKRSPSLLNVWSLNVVFGDQNSFGDNNRKVMVSLSSRRRFSSMFSTVEKQEL